MYLIDGQFGDSASRNGLKLYFYGEFAEEGKFCRVLLNSDSTDELRGGISEVGVPFSLNCSPTIDLNGEIAKNGVYG